MTVKITSLSLSLYLSLSLSLTHTHTQTHMLTHTHSKLLLFFHSGFLVSEPHVLIRGSVSSLPPAVSCNAGLGSWTSHHFHLVAWNTHERHLHPSTHQDNTTDIAILSEAWFERLSWNFPVCCLSRYHEQAHVSRCFEPGQPLKHYKEVDLCFAWHNTMSSLM